MIHIIGGSKTGYNLYQYLKSKKIGKAMLYYFPKEYSAKKRKGQPFEEWRKVNNTKIIISSETAFNHLPESYRDDLSTHYFVRNKENFAKIVNHINANYIRSFTLSDVQFPVALKPKDAMEKKVPFKIKKIKTLKELETCIQYLPDCIMQPYLNDGEYLQIAIAGYFDGYSSSLIAVEQKNHYPKGISAFVIDKTNENRVMINNITDYLNKISYKGFIELEFKKHKESGEYYLMDINPRPWGWFYYYLDGMKNFKEHLETNEPIKVELRKVWVNFPRLVLSCLKGNLSTPSLLDFIKGKICYEPYFQK